MIKELNMEKINLRKANALQGEIRKAISSSGVSDTVGITEYTADVAGGLEQAKGAYALDIIRKVALNTALFNIRKSVSQANNTSGISDLLADVQTLDAISAVYSGVATQTSAKSLIEIIARIDKMKAQPVTERSTLGLYGDRCNKVETSVVDQATIDVAKVRVKDLKRQKQDLQDKLLTLNVNTTITINDADAMMLKIEGIL